MNKIFVIVLFLFCASCSKKNTKQYTPKQDISITKSDTSIPIKEITFESFIKEDSSLKKVVPSVTYLFSDGKQDTLLSFSNCEKNVQKNTLKVQLRTAFPPLSKLKAGHREASILEPVQYRFLTFHLKDSTVQKAELLMASTEEQFNGKKLTLFLSKTTKLKLLNSTIA